MQIEKYILIKYLIMTLGFICAELLVFISENMMLHVFVMIAFSILAIIIGEIDPMHPYTWFSAFFVYTVLDYLF